MWYIIFAVLTIVSLYGLFLLFKKAGKQGWEAIVPFYREYVMAQLVGRPTWWVILLIVPIVNIFVFYGFYLDFIKAFGKRRFWENAAAVLVPFIVLPMWALDSTVKYLGQPNTEEFKKKYPYKKSVGREWADAIIFATVAASLIRGFLIEAYMIPTGSMERSLLVGDFLFVSKLNYGPRIPNTPIAFPFAHHTMPITGGKAYSELIEIPYKRLPGFEKIERNDVVVFNFPMEADAPYNRPVDKRENYIKRAVGAPGDVVEMQNGNLIVNGQPGYDSNDVQKAYIVFTDQNGLSPQILKDKRFEYNQQYDENGNVVYILYVTEEEIKEVEKWSNVQKVIMSDNPNPAFPKSDLYNWNFHNFGPLKVPAKGDVVELTDLSLPIYERLITVYEGNTLEKRDDGIYVNGVKSDNYTIKMDYYWMMGDNRDNSLDSRDFGFVPEDHIVGKALFTWLSWDADGSFLSKIRWNRFFRGIH
ncbi:signal peptidase I [Sphingobacterium rhinopitheci]|uniref:signal peptidase I n=1 Tax=Sphingobacterium rhinopitheci TaxID=2781960 RepID=UPI001F526889|nr:signal peptidase I [Sphingobacterium rhinopitheci]MCI0920483.1 signal peptidase I [Sphingobacterium rhinopitheci]